MRAPTRLRALRPGARGMRALAGTLAGSVLTAGVAVAGVTHSMAESYPSQVGAESSAVRSSSSGPVSSGPAIGRPAPARRAVAVVLSATGSVAGDVLAPFDVFARAEGFTVYTVSVAHTPVALSGGLRVVPQHTFQEVDAGQAAAPDVVVVPAVADPSGDGERAAREWIAHRARGGARILSVCAGAQLAAASGVLDGHRATSHWFTLLSLPGQFPNVRWVSGQRFVQDGTVTSTAGVSSGIAGALHLVGELGSSQEARRIGAEMAYPGWSLDGPTAIPARGLALGDVGYGLSVTFPWGRPTVAVGLQDGVPETDVAAVSEVYDGSSFAAQLVPVAATTSIRTQHGMTLLAELVSGTPASSNTSGSAGLTGPDADQLIVPGPANKAEVDPTLTHWARSRGTPTMLPGADRRPGESAFDPVLRALATTVDTHTARQAARFIEYPDGHLRLHGSRWPWRPTLLALATLAVAVLAGIAIARLNRPA